MRVAATQKHMEARAFECAADKVSHHPGDTCPMRRWLSFHHVWYSVDLPSGADPPKHPKNVEGKRPRLYLLNVRTHLHSVVVHGLALASASCSFWPTSM